MASQSKKDAEEALRLIAEEARLRERMNSSYDNYIEAVKEAHALQETLNKNRQLEQDIQNAINTGKRNGVQLTQQEIDVEKEKLKIIQKQNKTLEKQVDIYKKAAKEANVGAMALGKATKALYKTLIDLPGKFQGAYGKIKGLGLFELDKAMKQAALSMGVVGKETKGFRNTIVAVAKDTQGIGIGITELSQIQAQYSDNLGRTVLLSREGLKSLGEMAVATGLGAEGTAQMAADMELQGLSAEKTGEYIEKSMNNSRKMGLNASKVVKVLAKNMNMLNKYRFKDGVKGLEKMAALATKLGVEMNFASGFADKLWDVEGAVEAAAQLQVMGGEWANIGDTFHLMYMARNDMAGLTEEIGRAASKSVFFNERTGELDMTTKGMHQLKIIAEQTGMEYDALVTAGKNFKKYSMIKSQIRFSIGGGKEGENLKEYITNKAFLQDGKAYIQVKGEKKLMSTLTQQDKKVLMAQMNEQKSMRERAEESRTFDEKLTDLINQLKIYLLPMIDTMNEKLIPKIKKLSEDFNKPGGWGEKIEYFAKIMGKMISAVGGWIIEHPKLTAAIWAFSKVAPLVVGAFKLVSVLWEGAKWFKNGIALGQGFNTVAGGGGGGGGGGAPGGGPSGGGGFFGNLMRKQGFGRNRNLSLGKSLAGGAKAATGLGLVSLGTDVARGFMEDPNSGTGKALGAVGTAAGWAGTGAMIGSVIPGVGTLVGGIVGGVLGAAKGVYDEWYSDEAQAQAQASAGEALQYNPPIDDGLKLGGDFKGGLIKGITKTIPTSVDSNKTSIKGMGIGNHNPAIIDGGKITPYDRRDNVMLFKKNGDLDQILNKGNNNNGTIRHEFGNINVSGTIQINVPGTSAMAIDLNNESTKREIAMAVQEQVIKQFNQGKTTSKPR